MFCHSSMTWGGTRYCQAGVRLDERQHDGLLVCVGDGLCDGQTRMGFSAASHALELKDSVGIEETR